MLAPIRRDHAKSVLFGRVDCVIQKDDLIRNLNDFGWRTHARKTLRCALECRVFMTLMRAQVFHFLDHLRLIGRQVRTLEPVLQFSNLIRRLNGALLPALGVVCLSVRAVRSRADGVTPASRRPESGEIGMPVSQMRSWPFPCGLYFFRRWFSPRKTSSVG